MPAEPTAWPATVRIDLGDDNYANVQIEQRGIDVEALDPGGSCHDEPWSIDLRRGLSGREIVPLSTDPTHPTAVVRVRPIGDSPPANGDVVLSLADVRSAPRPAASCRGWRAFLDARIESFDRSPAGQERTVAGYARSAQHFRDATDFEGLGQALLNQAAAEHRLGRIEEALHHLSESRRHFRSLDSAASRRNLADALNETAWILYRKGRAELAAELFREAAALAEKTGERRILARALNGQGLAFKRLARWDDALEAYRRAAELAEDDPCVESAARTNLGTAHTRLGEFQQGLAELSRAVELATAGSAEEMPCRSLSAALNSQASLYTNLGRWDLAASASQEALLHASAGNRLVLMANHARALGHTRRTEDARRGFLDTIEAARGVDRDVEFASRINLAYLLLDDLGDADGARRHLVRAEALIDASAPSRETALLLTARSKLSLSADRPADAEAEALRAVEIGRDGGQVQQVGLALLRLARSRLALGRPEEAAAIAEEATRAVENLRSHTASYELRATYLADRSEYFETWIEALMEWHRLDPGGSHAELALAVAERARSRAFLDMLDSAAVERSESLDPALAELERRRESLFLRRNALSSDAAGDARQEHQLRRTEAEIVELKARLRASRPQWSQLREPEILDFEALRAEVVDPDTALLHSFVGDRTSWLWLVTEQGVEVIPCPGRDRLDDQVRRLLTALRARARVIDGEDLETRRRRIRRADADFEIVGRELSRLLPHDALREQAARRLAVVADGPLAYVPFGALPDPAADKYRPLVLDYQWVYLTSVSILRPLRRHAATKDASEGTSNPRVAVVADPIFSSADPRLAARGETTGTTTRSGLDRPFRRLAQSGLEARTVASLGGPDSLVAVGVDATASWVRSGRLRGFDIVHFATHGVIEAEYPELSALVFSLRDASGRPIDGFLRLPDIYRLELDAELVVLSACETALGQQIRGEGLVGLTRGFHYAGASSVLASLWAVQDRATRDLMERFYRDLLEDRMRPIDALHAVQRSLAVDPAMTPYHWAGFVMQGDWR